MRKEYILTEEEKQRKRQKIEENRIRKTSVTSEEVLTHAQLVRLFSTLCLQFSTDCKRYLSFLDSE